MTTKCTHDTTAILADEGNVTIESCTWGCGELLVTVTDSDGISHGFAADELARLRATNEDLRAVLHLKHDECEAVKAELAALREVVGRADDILNHFGTDGKTSAGGLYGLENGEGMLVDGVLDAYYDAKAAAQTERPLGARSE